MAEVCWLAQFSDRPCDGRLVRCHLIPKQQMRKAHATLVHMSQIKAESFHGAIVDELFADPRGWVVGCGGPTGVGGHHGMLDASRSLRIPFGALPAGTIEFAAELGLTWWLEREYG